MARVRNVQLTAGRGSDGREFAEVTYDIAFSDAEVSLNLQFDEMVLLAERDEKLDGFFQDWGSNLDVQQIAVDNPDDFIGTIHEGTIKPEGRRTVRRTHRREWPFPRNEDGNEEYRALVMVVPEIYRGSAWSNEVSINLA
jgi:hypothetical protein